MSFGAAGEESGAGEGSQTPRRGSFLCSATLQGRAVPRPHEAEASHYASHYRVGLCGQFCSATLQGRAVPRPHEAEASHYASHYRVGLCGQFCSATL
jgi:hypothetical protein